MDKSPYPTILLLNNLLLFGHPLLYRNRLPDLFHSPTLQLLFPLQEGPLVFVEKRPSLRRDGGRSLRWSWSLACPKERCSFCFIHMRKRGNGRRHPSSPTVPLRLYPRITWKNDMPTTTPISLSHTIPLSPSPPPSSPARRVFPTTEGKNARARIKMGVYVGPGTIFCRGPWKKITVSKMELRVIYYRKKGLQNSQTEPPAGGGPLPTTPRLRSRGRLLEDCLAL